MNKKAGLAIGIIAIIGIGTGIGLIFLLTPQKSPIDPLLLLILGPMNFNKCPTISGVPDQIKYVPVWELNVTPYISDPDTPILSLMIYENSTMVITISNSSGHYLSFNFPPDYAEYVKITVGDGKCNASQTILAYYISD